MSAQAWISPIVLRPRAGSAATLSPIHPRTAAFPWKQLSKSPTLSPAAPSTARSRLRVRRRPAVMQSSPSTDNLPLVTVSADADLPSPGEHRQLTLDYTLLTAILQSDTTAFGLVPYTGLVDGSGGGGGGGIGGGAAASDAAPTSSPAPSADASDSRSPATPATGALLTILRIDAVSQQSLSAAVRVHCAARLAVRAVQHASADTAGLSRARDAVAVHDVATHAYAERAALAADEWELWRAVREASSLQRRLLDGRVSGGRGPKGGSDARFAAGAGAAEDDLPPSLAQRVFVWAPREYDHELDERDWMRTPDANRVVWMRRAEAFSFAVVRAFSTGDGEVRRARDIMCTRERVAMAMGCVDAAISRMSAQLCVDEALRSE